MNTLFEVVREQSLYSSKSTQINPKYAKFKLDWLGMIEAIFSPTSEQVSLLFNC